MQFKGVDMNLRRLYWEANYVKPDSVAVHIALKNLKLIFLKYIQKNGKFQRFKTDHIDLRYIT